MEGDSSSPHSFVISINIPKEKSLEWPVTLLN